MSRPLAIGSGMWHAVLAGGLDAVLHHAQTNPTQLAPLSGRIMELHLEPFDSTIRLAVSPDGIQVTHDHNAPVDVCLSGTLGAWAAFGLRRDYRQDPLSTGIRVTGDPDLVAAVLSLMTAPPHDLPPQNHSINDVPQPWMALVTANLKQNLAEYWQEESRELPASAEVEILFRGINETRIAVEQLEERYHRLLRQPTP